MNALHFPIILIGVAGLAVAALVFFLSRVLPAGRRHPIALSVATVTVLAVVFLAIFTGPRIVDRMRFGSLMEEPFRSPELFTTTTSGGHVVDRKITPTQGTMTHARLSTYNSGRCGVVEIGDVRLAFEGCVFDGARKDSVIVSTDSEARHLLRARPSVVLGGTPSFRHAWYGNVLACSLGDIEFEVRDCVIHFGDRTIPIGQGRRVLLFRRGATDFIELTE